MLYLVLFVIKLNLFCITCIFVIIKLFNNFTDILKIKLNLHINVNIKLTLFIVMLKKKIQYHIV